MKAAKRTKTEPVIMLDTYGAFYSRCACGAEFSGEGAPTDPGYRRAQQAEQAHTCQFTEDLERLRSLQLSSLRRVMRPSLLTTGGGKR